MSTATAEMKTQAQPAGTYKPKGMLIGGKWVESVSGARITIENPGKRTAVAEVPRAAEMPRAQLCASLHLEACYNVLGPRRYDSS